MNKFKIKASVIVPTKNRPNDLSKALESIMNQSIRPDEIIIIDQSDGIESKNRASLIFKNFNFLNFKYILDRSISGLVEAKKISISYASSDLVLFLEDDIVLDIDYIEEIILGFYENKKMVGCSGIIKNHPRNGKLYSFLFHLFHVGIFKDNRFEIFESATNFSGRLPLVKCNKLSGGVSAWKKVVFTEISFDVLNRFHLLEDIDFSTRVGMKFGDCLYINPNAKLDHNFSPLGRSGVAALKRRKTRESITYYKKRSNIKGAFFSLTVLMIGMFFESILQSIMQKSFDPVFGWALGLRDGISQRLVLYDWYSL